MDRLELFKKEELLDKLAIEILGHYKLYEHVIPTFPNVIVRVLPKEMVISGIHIVDQKTHKPTYEGIVLRTWEPKIVWPKKEGGMPVEFYSDLKPGDHVLFPHFAGQALPGLDEDKYRSIPEGITKNGRVIFGNDTGVIIGKIDYKRESVEENLQKILSNGLSYDIDYAPDIIRMIKENFDIVVKEKFSRTKSGV